MPSFQINDEEREALRGLPMLAREIYVFALRPFMDFATGVVGERRGISWKSIAEELYVEPHQGIKGGEPSEKELRRALVWLQKVGLVGPNLAERRLIFELPKASRDQSVRKKWALSGQMKRAVMWKGRSPVTTRLSRKKRADMWEGVKVKKWAHLRYPVFLLLLHRARTRSPDNDSPCMTPGYPAPGAGPRH